MSNLFGAAWLLAALVFLLPTLAFGQATREAESDTVEPPAGAVGDMKDKPDLDKVREGIVTATNQFRQQQRCGNLKTNAALAKSAQGFADYMAAHDRFSHTADGHEPWDRMTQAGYAYCIALENIAWEYNSEGFPTDALTKQLVDGWEHSPPHRKNMLDPDVTDIGVGVAYSPKSGRYYAVQDYGRPQSDRITFQIANKTDAEVKYALNGKDFKLGPGYTVTHERCRPPELRFQWPAGADATAAAKEAAHPAAGASYVIRKNDAGAFTVDAR